MNISKNFNMEIEKLILNDEDNDDAVSNHLPKIKLPSYICNILDDMSIEMRLKVITKRQEESKSMFDRLQVIIDQMEENLKPQVIEEEMSPKQPAYISDHNYALSNSSSGVSSSSSSSPSPTNEQQRFKRCSKSSSAKRKIIDDDDDEQEYHEFSAEDAADYHQQSIEREHSQYPKNIGDFVILGPNGTQIHLRSYSSIIWSSAASATRQLLGFVFSSDVLATHTLTGKPSPAFYGRERPAKMQLDPIKAADIIHCVRSQFNCSEREIRAAITTKCSDTSKKYKRRHQKQLESSQKK